MGDEEMAGKGRLSFSRSNILAQKCGTTKKPEEGSQIGRCQELIKFAIVLLLYKELLLSSLRKGDVSISLYICFRK